MAEELSVAGNREPGPQTPKRRLSYGPDIPLSLAKPSEASENLAKEDLKYSAPQILDLRKKYSPALLLKLSHCTKTAKNPSKRYAFPEPSPWQSSQAVPSRTSRLSWRQPQPKEIEVPYGQKSPGHSASSKCLSTCHSRNKASKGSSTEMGTRASCSAIHDASQPGVMGLQPAKNHRDHPKCPSIGKAPVNIVAASHCLRFNTLVLSHALSHQSVSWTDSAPWNRVGIQMAQK